MDNISRATVLDTRRSAGNLMTVAIFFSQALALHGGGLNISYHLNPTVASTFALL